MPMRTRWEVDHFPSWSRHPDNTINNLVAAHAACKTELLDTAAAHRLQHEQHAAAMAAARQALREQQRAAARQRHLDELAQDPETAWADAERLISTRLPAQSDAAVALLGDLQELAQREDQAPAFARRFAALREAHLRKPSLIARFDRAGLAV